MRVSDDKKVDLAKDILVAHIATSPPETRDVDAVCMAIKKVFKIIDEILETS